MGPGFGSFPRGSSYPFLFLPYCCKYFNKMEKEKKRQKKSKKISSLEATGHLQPRPARTFSGTEQRPALAARTSCVYIPAGVGSRQSSFLHSRDKNLEATANQRTCPSQHRSFRLCSVLPASVSPPGACTSLPAPLARRHLHTQRCFCQDGCPAPLSSCLYITSGIMAGRRRLVSHPEKGKEWRSESGSWGRGWDGWQ